MTENMQHPRPSYVSRSSQAKMLRPCQMPAILPPHHHVHSPALYPPSAICSRVMHTLRQRCTTRYEFSRTFKVSDFLELQICTPARHAKIRQPSLIPMICAGRKSGGNLIATYLTPQLYMSTVTRTSTYNHVAAVA